MRITLFLPLLLLGACSGNDDSKKEATTVTTARGEATSSETCYRRVQGRDTFALHLVRNGDELSGDLGFDNYEKDSSRGTVTGKATGNVFRLVYEFQSEGMTSVMEIFFRKEGNALVRGTGEMANMGDTVRYKNPAAVTYPSAERWESVPCVK